MEIEDYFIKKLQGMAVSPENTVPILNKHLKGYVPDGRHVGIACNKFPGGIDQFTEVKVIHNGTLQYRRMDIRDDQSWAAVFKKFKGYVSKSYLINLKRKDQVHHGTAEGAREPLEAIFRQLNFKPLVFGTFGEMSSNVGDLMETVVEYGVEYLGT